MKNFERTLLRKFFSSEWIEQLKILFKDYRAHYSDIETLRGGVAVENWHSSKRTRSSGGAILRIRIKYWWPAWYRLMRIHRIPFPSLPQRFVSRLSLEEDSSNLHSSYLIQLLSLFISRFLLLLPFRFDASYDEPFRVLFAPRDMPCLLGESISQPIHTTEIRKRGGINEKFS